MKGIVDQAGKEAASRASFRDDLWARHGKEDRKNADKINDVWVWSGGQRCAFWSEKTSCLRSTFKYCSGSGVRGWGGGWNR